MQRLSKVNIDDNRHRAICCCWTVEVISRSISSVPIVISFIIQTPELQQSTYQDEEWALNCLSQDQDNSFPSRKISSGFSHFREKFEIREKLDRLECCDGGAKNWPKYSLAECFPQSWSIILSGFWVESHLWIWTHLKRQLTYNLLVGYSLVVAKDLSHSTYSELVNKLPNRYFSLDPQR